MPLNSIEDYTSPTFTNIRSSLAISSRHQHYTVTLLLTAVHDWARFLEKHHSVHCIFLNLAKAFDSVPHSRLLLK